MAASGKRYYWLRLQEDFFNSMRIKKLRKIAGGDTYTIIYLKMQLLAMKHDGVLEHTGLEPTFAEELALELDEAADNVSVTVNYLLSCGLLETTDSREYFVPYSVLNTGSETASAKRVREYRERKALQCNTGVTVAPLYGNGEKEIREEIREEINISGSDSLISYPSSRAGAGEETGEDVENPVENFVHARWAELSPESLREGARLTGKLFPRWCGRNYTQEDEYRVAACVDRYGAELVMYAFEQALQNGKPGNWNYINGILRKLESRGVESLEQAEDFDGERGRQWN